MTRLTFANAMTDFVTPEGGMRNPQRSALFRHVRPPTWWPVWCRGCRRFHRKDQVL
jgi:hypothetical protein